MEYFQYQHLLNTYFIISILPDVIFQIGQKKSSISIENLQDVFFFPLWGINFRQKSLFSRESYYNIINIQVSKYSSYLKIWTQCEFFGIIEQSKFTVVIWSLWRTVFVQVLLGLFRYVASCCGHDNSVVSMLSSRVQFIPSVYYLLSCLSF